MPTATVEDVSYISAAEIEQLVEAFESRRLARARWTHEAHLTVALWYLFHYQKALATDLIREGIKAYNQSVNIVTTKSGGYHETLTLFYVELIDAYLSKTGRHSIVESVNELRDSYGDRQIPLAFYSETRLLSWEARVGWVEPDLRPLKFGVTRPWRAHRDERLIDTL